ncbi:MAG: YesL family protein [Erysipelotrichaceae bacterium]|nr:YesL family protein [Erysipelotrichaceae bacterium]
MEKLAGRLTNIVLLGFFATLFSLPVVTAGAAFTALNVSTKAYLYEDEDKVLRIFFESFKEHFVLSTKVWLIHLLAFAILIWDIAYYRVGETSLDILASAAIFVLIVFLLFEFQLVFVLIGERKESRVFKLMKLALEMAFTCFWQSLMMALFTLTVIAVSIFLFRGLLLVMPGIIAYLDWQVLPELFRKYKFRERQKTS